MTQGQTTKIFLTLTATLLLCCSFGFGQTNSGHEGIAAFSPADSVEMGSVNLANLNISFDLPVRSKPGFFGASLQRNNNMWIQSSTTPYTATLFDSTVFHLVTALGDLQVLNIGPCGGGSTFTNFEFRDSGGATHAFSGSVNANDACGLSSVLDTTNSFGWHLHYDANDNNARTVTDPSGNVYNVGYFTPSKTDRNGNVISATNAVSGPFYDASGATVLSTTVVSSVIQSYNYTGFDGATKQVSVTYINRPSKVVLGCANVADGTIPANEFLLSRLDYPDGTNVQVTYESTPGFPTYTTGRIKTIKLRTGATITYTYNGLHNGFNCEDLGTSGFTRQTPDGTWTYSRTLLGQWHISGQWKTVVTAPGGQKYTYNFTGTAPYYQVSYEAQESNGSVVQHTYDCYNGNTAGCETKTSIGTGPLTSHYVYTRFGTDTTQTFRTETYFNSIQLPTSIRQFDFDGATRLTATNITYGTYGANGCTSIAGILDHPCTVLVADSNNVTMKVDYNTYDADGNLTMNQKFIGNGTYYRTVNTYNPNGTLATTHLQTGGVIAPDTTSTYGECNGFGLTQIAAGGLTTGQHNDCNGGVPLSTTDANGQSTIFAYNDPLWRKTSVTDPAGNVTNFTYTANSIESKMLYNGNASVDDVVTTFDSLGRTKLVQKRLSPTSTNYRTVQTNYNSNGQVSSVTRPCPVALGAACAASPTTFSYDAIGRPTNIVHPNGGSVGQTYNGRDVLSTLSPAPTGESTKQKRLEYDAIGRLLSVCEITTLSGNGSCGQYISAPHGYMTTYTRTTASTDNVLTITQGSQTRTMHYDKIGRLLSETHPEGGTTTYTYDTATVGVCSISSAGDMVVKTEPDGVSTCITYDSIHRPLTVKHNPALANSSPDSYFVYDGATVNGNAMQNASGRLAEAYTCSDGTCSSKVTDFGFSYNARGDILNQYEKTPHSPATYYNLALTYRATGQLFTLDMGALPTITYGINGEGAVNQVTDSNGVTLASGVGFETDGSVNGVTFSTGDAAAFTFDAPTGRMKTYQETINGSVVKGTYGWNANGTMASLTIVNPFNAGDAQTCTYTHDDLVRITGAHCGTDWDQTFSYDQFGNLTKTGSMSWQPGYNQANNKYLLAGTTYNSKGELTADTFHNYTWGADNAPTAVDSITFTYDPFGRVVEKNDAGVFTEFVYLGRTKLTSMNGASVLAGWVPLPGGTVARYSGSSVAKYFVSDVVGSLRVGSTTARVYTGSAFAPFGEQYAVGNSGPASFTGIGQNTTADEYDFLYRRLHESQGRWISPDQGPMNLADPQSLNRYAYLANRPLLMIDEDGNEPVGEDVSIIEALEGINGEGLEGFLVDFGPCSNDSDSFCFKSTAFAPLPTVGPWLAAAGWGCLYFNTGCGQGMGGGNARQPANNGFTLGIRAPGQTYKQCLAANSSTYSINNWLPSSAQNGATKFALGNDVSGALFGDANEGTAGLLVGAGVGAAPLGVGTAGTFGRRTASIFNLNLSGTTGPAPTILGKTGAAEVVGWVSGAFELKLAADIGATAAEALNCIGHR